VICRLCGQRKTKRACPALGHDICPTCCATKRLREIACPSDCVHLASARAHPPAVVQRQRERDTAFLVGLIRGLDEAQIVLLSVAQQHLRRYRPTALPALVDADVTEAARAMAATLETAARGIVYEHETASLPAQRVLSIFRALHAEIETRRPTPAKVLGVAFRRLELASRTAAEQLGGGETAFLDFVDRLAAGAAERSGGAESEPASDAPRIILP
jgi:hypothetical protein